MVKMIPAIVPEHTQSKAEGQRFHQEGAAFTGRSYDGMEISEGGEASIKFYTVTYDEDTKEE